MFKGKVGILIVGWLVLMGMVSCTPGSEVPLPVEGGAETAAEQPLDSTEGTDAAEVDLAGRDEVTQGQAGLESTTQDGPVQEGDVVVQSTPLSEEELANQPAESAPGGAGGSEPGGGSDGNPGGLNEAEIDPASWPVYKDATYRFAVKHPADFVIRPLDSAALGEFAPAPLASIRLMSPAVANSAVGDLEIPELNVRVFPAPQDGSLEGWLAASGLTAEGDSVEPFQNAAVSGVRACLSVMLAPNCSIFVLGNGWVYQLTPLGLVGEAMVDSFALSS